MAESHNGVSQNRPVERKFSARFCLGCDFFAWLRIMTKGRFNFTLPHMHIGVVTSLSSFGHTFLKYVHNALFRRQIERTEIKHPPIFIIGHWRTGTTLLHELMILDSQFNFPNTFQCLMPNHFLLTEKLLKRWFAFLLPKHRPMDNMAVSWDKPQEDEFALCLLGQPSPYMDIIFPNRASLAPGSLDLQGLTPVERRNWKRTFHWFLKTLTAKDPRQLILKSPPHSCRIPTLLELFPDARFIHIVRNPYTVFPSTVKLWKSLADKHGVQTPLHRDVEERVFSTFPQVYQKLEEGKRLVDPSRFHELKYEDLVKDPVREIKLVYERLGLAGFETMKPKLVEYTNRNANYETNKFQLSPAQRDEITKRWGHVIKQYGYTFEHGKEPLPMPQVHQPDDLLMPVPDVLRFPTSTATVSMPVNQPKVEAM